MICPFRLDVEFEYMKLSTGKKDEEPSYLEKSTAAALSKVYGRGMSFL